MPNEKLRVAYLLGSGASHAEKSLQCKMKKVGLDKSGVLKKGILARDVSGRVIENLLKTDPALLERYGISEFSLKQNPIGIPSLDIELFISLLEAIKIDEVEKDAKKVRGFFRADICRNLLLTEKIVKPSLHASLIELHGQKSHKEELIGFLTLNYDSLLEEAFRLTKSKFDYGLDIESPLAHHQIGGQPLLKLHGSFDWFLDQDKDKIIVSQKGLPTTMQWIPPRLNKEYLNYPYNIIHGRAYELLSRCDILRVIGCSLSQNDLGLIALLFKTQHKGSNPYEIEMISSEKRLQAMTERLGMSLSFAESFYSKDGWTKLQRHATENNFLDWLVYKVESLSGRSIANTKYLKHIRNWAKFYE